MLRCLISACQLFSVSAFQRVSFSVFPSSVLLLGQDLFGDGSVDVGEAEVAAGVAVGEAFVVEAEEMQDGGVPVVDVHLVVNGFVAVVVRHAVVHAAFDAAASHPHGEAFVVVVPAIGALAVRGAAKLAAPDDEGVFQEAALLEVREQAGDGGIDAGAVVFKLGLEIEVLIPIAVGDLNKAHACFDELAGHEALLAKGGGGVVLKAVHLLGGGRFFAEIEDLGNLCLHAEGELVGFDDAFDLRADAAIEFHAALIEGLDEIKLGALGLGAVAVVFDVGDAGVIRAHAEAACERAAAWEPGAAKFRALIDGREEGAAEGAGGVGGWIDGDEAGEVFIHGAEAIQSPGPEGWTHKLGGAGVELGKGLGMGGDIRGHGIQDAKVIRVTGDAGQEFGDPEAAATMLTELPRGGHELSLSVPTCDGGCVFPAIGDELGLVVEQIDMRWRALHAEEDDVLGPGGEVGILRGERGAAGGCGLQCLLLSHGCKGQITEAAGRGL